MTKRVAQLALLPDDVPEHIESANHRYRKAGGEWQPGVTGILRIQDALGGSDGLIRWAVGLAAKAAFDTAIRPEQPMFEEALRTALLAVDEARDRGSRIHQGIDDAVRDRQYDVMRDDAGIWYHWSRFLLKYRIEPQTEQYILGDGFGGTYDLAAEIDGELALIDVKTGKWKDSFGLQLAAYSMGIWQAPKPDFGGIGSPVVPVPQFAAFYVLMLSDEGYALKPVVVGQAERDHFRFLVATHKQLKEWSK